MENTIKVRFNIVQVDDQIGNKDNLEKKEEKEDEVLSYFDDGKIVFRYAIQTSHDFKHFHFRLLELKFPLQFKREGDVFYAIAICEKNKLAELYVYCSSTLEEKLKKIAADSRISRTLHNVDTKKLEDKVAEMYDEYVFNEYIKSSNELYY
jgi:hypothetical protein